MLSISFYDSSHTTIHLLIIIVIPIRIWGPPYQIFRKDQISFDWHFTHMVPIQNIHCACNLGCMLSLSPSNHVNHFSLFILIWISVEDKFCFVLFCFVCWISYSHILINSIPVLYSMTSVYFNRAFDSTLPSENLKRLMSYSNYPLFLLYNLSLRQRDHQILLVVSVTQW